MEASSKFAALPLGLAANLVQDDIRDGMAGFIGKIQPLRGLFHLLQIMFHLRLGVCQMIVHIGRSDFQYDLVNHGASPAYRRRNRKFQRLGSERHILRCE